MAHKTASPAFVLRKRIEGVLSWALGDAWIPQYSMVSFTRIPYEEVLRRARRQDAILDWAAAGVVAAAVAGGVYAAVKAGLPAALARAWSAAAVKK